MKNIYMNPGKVNFLGYYGETEEITAYFKINDFNYNNKDALTNSGFSLVNGWNLLVEQNEHLYLQALVEEDESLLWKINSPTSTNAGSVLATEGVGRCQVLKNENGVISKSNLYYFSVGESIENSSEVKPPNLDDWVSELVSNDSLEPATTLYSNLSNIANLNEKIQTIESAADQANEVVEAAGKISLINEAGPYAEEILLSKDSIDSVVSAVTQAEVVLEAARVAEIVSDAGLVAQNVLDAEKAAASVNQAYGAAEKVNAASEEIDKFVENTDVAEAWAVGTKSGIAVSSSEPQYNNHSKYWASQTSSMSAHVDEIVVEVEKYAKQAETSANNASNNSTAAATAASAAASARDTAVSAKNAAEEAKEAAEKARDEAEKIITSDDAIVEHNKDETAHPYIRELIESGAKSAESVTTTTPTITGTTTFGLKFWKGTKSEYTALAKKDSQTLYIVVADTNLV